MEYRLTTPCTAQDLAPLKAGDTVLLSGVVYTARDQAHKRMIEALDKGEALPFDLTGSAIYYVGPTPERPGEVIGSAGPTTSGRMDAMSPRLLDLGNKIMIGKGKRDAAVKEAVVRNGAVYLAALGGAGALMAKSVETLEVIAWPDLGCEAVRRLTVRDMPLTVILDAHGGDLYQVRPGSVSGKRKLTGFVPCTKQTGLELANPLFCAEESWFVCTNFLQIACINGKSVISCNIQTVVLCIPAENFPPWGGARQEANIPCRSTNPQKIILKRS